MDNWADISLELPSEFPHASDLVLSSTSKKKKESNPVGKLLVPHTFSFLLDATKSEPRAQVARRTTARAVGVKRTFFREAKPFPWEGACPVETFWVAAARERCGQTCRRGKKRCGQTCRRGKNKCVVRHVVAARKDVVRHVVAERKDMVRHVVTARKDLVRHVVAARKDVVRNVVAARKGVVRHVVAERKDVVMSSLQEKMWSDMSSRQEKMWSDMSSRQEKMWSDMWSRKEKMWSCRRCKKTRAHLPLRMCSAQAEDTRKTASGTTKKALCTSVRSSSSKYRHDTHLYFPRDHNHRRLQRRPCLSCSDHSVQPRLRLWTSCLSISGGSFRHLST